MTPDTSLCVFYKRPRAGEVKTRLIPEVGARGAARLAEAFFRDTWNCVATMHWATPVIATTEPLISEDLPRPETSVWLQGDGDLGARIERILQRGLAGTRFAMAIGADSPGIPAEFYERAHEAMKTADAVLGPSDDGGFYLLGLRRCPAGLLSGIPWSQSITFAATLKRLAETGMKVAVIDSWFDIDVPEDLHRLERQLAAQSMVAPETQKALQTLRMQGKLRSLSAAEYGARKVSA